MARITGENRNFLFLQGPHGPFFGRLSKMLRRSGAKVWRVGFNRGDQAFWPDNASFIPFTDPQDQWIGQFEQIVDMHGITDIVLYGDTRPHSCPKLSNGHAHRG